ncbi:MAG: hypothetical protein HHJ16_16480 [Polaromonas sp.]|uniref:hypothetical protein n=1 Tax=Polaromonas sp. TaxID=1869339 RepID=UPI00180C54F7|nr:hypothetical protein [Polaromonas sp.]NMM11851.1 hypothetical protein [Polaromonas sp.]
MKSTTYVIEGWLEDSEAHGQVLLEPYRVTLYESDKPVRSTKFKMRETCSSLMWIYKRLSEVTAIDIEYFIAECLLSVPPDTESEFLESRL